MHQIAGRWTAFTPVRGKWLRLLLTATIMLLCLGEINFAVQAQDEAVILVRGDRNYPPYEFMQNGQATGFNVDLMRAVAEVMGLNVEIELGPWKEVRAELESGRIDALAGMYRSPEREGLVDFSVPHSVVSFTVFVRTDSSIRSLDDVRGKTVIVQQDDIMHDYLKTEAIPARIIPVTDAPEVLRRLSAGEADAAFLPRMQGLYLIDRFGLTNIEAVGNDLLPREYAFAVAKGNQQLLAQLNEGLNILKTTGEYQRLQEKWFGVYEKNTLADMLPYFWWGLAVIGLLLTGILVWNRMLKRQIDRRVAQLHQSEAQFRLLFEQAPIGMAMTGLDGHYLQVNRAFCDTLDYSADELQRMTFAEISHPDDMLLNNKLVAQLLAEEIQQFQMEKRYFTKGGQLVYTLLQVSLIYDLEQQPICFVSQVVDITEQQLSQQTLQENQLRLAGIINSAMDAIITLDADQQIVLFNQAAEKMFGYSVNEILGQPVDTLIPPDRRQPHRHHISQFAQTGTTARQMDNLGELSGYRRDGTEFPIEASISKIKTAGQTFFTIILRDITHRKEAEQAIEQHRLEIEEQQKFLRQIIDSNPNLIFVKDREGRFLLVNQAVADQFGAPVEEIIGKTDTDFNPNPEQVAFFHKIDKLVFETGQEQFVSEEKVTDVHGQVHWMQTVKRPIFDKNGQVVRLLGVAVDITERKQLEERLRQSQKMQAVGQLAGGVAHDFNNILTVITGYTEMLLLKHENEDDPDYKDIRQIKKMADRATSLTRQLLAFSRRQVLQPEVININEVISNIEKMLRRLISENIELVIDLSPDVGQIQADQGQLEQIIINLAINARDAMPKGGQLTIQTANIELGDDDAARFPEMSPGPYVMFSITDTGQGIDAETQARIFEPFFTTKEVGEGTGLGLSMVHGIVQQSNGHIEVQSEPQHGATFTIYLPRLTAEKSSDPRPNLRQATVRGTETILLVEDEADVREMAQQALKNNGYTVLTAQHGPEAMETCKKQPGVIDLLIADVILPGGITGPELAEYLHPVYPGMKTLFISGYTDNKLVQHSLSETDTAFLRKPFTPSELAQKIRLLLDSKK